MLAVLVVVDVSMTVLGQVITGKDVIIILTMLKNVDNMMKVHGKLPLFVRQKTAAANA